MFLVILLFVLGEKRPVFADSRGHGRRLVDYSRELVVSSMVEYHWRLSM
jgi:hypothetical protein